MTSATPAWASISELARLRGVAVSGLSKRIARLEAQGLLHPKSGPRGAKLIDVASFDRVARETEDGVRALNGRRSASTSPVTPTAPVLVVEQTRKVRADADLRELDRDERLGQLVRGDKIRDAILDAVRMHKKVFGQLVSRAEENAAAVRKDGVQGARDFLRRLELELLEDFADRAIEVARLAEQKEIAIDAPNK